MSSEDFLLSDEQVSDAIQDITDRLIFRAPDDELTHFIIRDEMSRLRPTEMTTSELDEVISERLRHLCSVLEDFFLQTNELISHSGGHPQENIPMKPNIISAISLLRSCYQQERDETDSLFILHPLDVLEELNSSGITDEVILSAGLLHDILLYSDLDEDDIRQNQGEEVARLVSELYYDLTPPTEELKQRLISRTSGLSERAQAIVIADLTTNLRWMKRDSTASRATEVARVIWSQEMVEQITNPHPVLVESFRDALNDFCDDRGYPPDEVSTNKETSDLTDIIKSDDSIINLDDIKNDDAAVIKSDDEPKGEQQC